MQEEYLIHGFMDGVLDINGEIIIEEIKSTQEDLDFITEDYHLEHLAQLKLYAYLYSIQNEMEKMHIRLTYISTIDYETKSFDSILTQEELEDFFFKVLEEYIEFLKFEKTEENLTFIQKKRSNNSCLDDIENIYGEDKGENKNKKKATKKTKKKSKKITIKDKKIIKMNNKKDGLKINLYLNQIQVNNYKLENFPFFPLLKIKENIKIEFLKGIINKKNLIKINKKQNFKCIKE
jgi:hypothetical protein